MKTLLITDRFSDSSRQTLMKIRKNVTLDKSVKLKIEETMPWIRISLKFDENSLNMRSLIDQLSELQCVAAEI